MIFLHLRTVLSKNYPNKPLKSYVNSLQWQITITVFLECAMIWELHIDFCVTFCNVSYVTSVTH